MMYDLRIYPAVQQDLDEAALHIARDSHENAIGLYEAVYETLKAIRS